jgi:starch synthase
MACSVPVVASAVGGIPEIVVPGQTGELVAFESDGTPRGEPKDPARFARDLAEKLNTLLDSPARARELGEAGRQRVLEQFSWTTIADQTVALYAEILG